MTKRMTKQHGWVREVDGEALSTFFLGAVVAGITALLMSGCASAPSSNKSESLKQAQFIPTDNPGMAQEEKHSVTYNVPISTHPEGKIEVVSKGIESIRSRKSDKDLPALHIQLIVSNEQPATLSTSRTWLLDARSQRLRLRSDLLLRPALVEAEAVALPIIEVKPGQTSTIDLFYAIPKQLQTSSSLPGFEVEWQIQTPRRLVSRMTKFNQELKNQSTADIYPFDHSGDQNGRLGRGTDYPAMDPALAPDANLRPPGNYRSIPQGPASDATWWADPFTEFPFPWRDMVY